MKCPRCHAENEKGAIYCATCTAALKEATPSEEDLRAAERALQQKKQEEMRKRRLWITGIAVCLLLAGSAVLCVRAGAGYAAKRKAVQAEEKREKKRKEEEARAKQAELQAKEAAEKQAKEDREAFPAREKACLEGQASWVKKTDSAKKAARHLKTTNLQYPPTRDTIMAALCADLNALKTIEKNGFKEWSNPEIMLAACRTPFIAVVQFIHEKGGDVNAKNESGTTALINASFVGDTEIVKYLIEHGAKIDERAKDGLTVLMCAVARDSNPDTVEYLIEKGADVNAKTDTGATALMLASSVVRNLEIVKCLGEHDAKIDEKTKEGMTALMCAAARSADNLDTVMYLLHKGADVNAKDNDGRTVLMYASGIMGNLETVTYLVNQGADVNAKDKDGRTASDLAKDKAVKKWLLSEMARSGK